MSVAIIPWAAGSISFKVIKAAISPVGKVQSDSYQVAGKS